jgi:DNA-binding GntR family transcriptional regulator
MTVMPSSRAAIKPRSLTMQVYDEVQRLIGSGALAPGAAVNIAELVRHTGVSQTPVREALARLAAEGRLTFVPNVGFRLPEAPTAKQYTEWAVSRVIVESNALRYILGPIDPRIVDEAAAINAQIRTTDFGTSAAGVRKFTELNWRFHAKLITLARNSMLEDVHARLYAMPQFSRVFLGRGIPNQHQIAKEHEDIIKQLRKGHREAAARALRDHIVDSLERDARMSDATISLRRLIRGQETDPEPW